MVSSGFSIVTEMSMSSMTSMACWFQEPAVSMAISVKMWVMVIGEVFESTALLAADPAWAEVVSKCESAKVSETVTSDAIGFPQYHRSSVTLSGLLLSLCSVRQALLWKGHDRCADDVVDL